MALNPRELEFPAGIEKRDYQVDALCGVVSAWEGGDHANLLVMPTGTGKTAAAGMIAKYAIEQLDRKVLFIAHREELIRQAETAFVSAFGFETAIEKASESEAKWKEEHGNRTPEVVIACIASLHTDRLQRRYDPKRFGLIIVDEAHHVGGKSYGTVFDFFQGAYRLGITATPDRIKNKWFRGVAYRLRMKKAIEDGWLVRPIVRKIPVPVNLKDIRTVGGDFDLDAVSQRLSPAMECLCTQIKSNIGDRQTVAFLPDVGAAQACAEMLRQMGVSAEYVSGDGSKYGMSMAVRKERLASYKSREYQVICCCDLLIEGWDLTSVSAVVIARPTRKRDRYVQMVGRGMRICPELGKTTCLILDLDWQAEDGTRELCRAHVILADDDVPDAALELLGRIIDRPASPGKSKEDLDILSVLNQIMSDTQKCSILSVEYTGKHSTLYDAIESDPIGIGRVLDIDFNKRRDFDVTRSGPATPWQIDQLKSFGVHGQEKMSLWGASRLIQKLKSREKKGLASHQYVKRLLALGVNEDQARCMSPKEAAAVMAEVRLKEQGKLF